LNTFELVDPYEAKEDSRKDISWSNRDGTTNFGIIHQVYEVTKTVDQVTSKNGNK